MTEVRSKDLPRSPENVCPACGSRFVCGMNAGSETCWCAQLPLRMPLPDVAAGSLSACLCPACLGKQLAGPGSD